MVNGYRRNTLCRNLRSWRSSSFKRSIITTITQRVAGFPFVKRCYCPPNNNGNCQSDSHNYFQLLQFQGTFQNCHSSSRPFIVSVVRHLINFAFDVYSETSRICHVYSFLNSKPLLCPSLCIIVFSVEFKSPSP